MASIETRTRTDGTLAYRVVWRDPDSKKKDSLTFDDPAEADRAVKFLNANGQRLTDALKAISAIKDNVPTVADIIDHHITHLTGISARTRKDYRGIAKKHIIPELGAFPINVDNLDDLAKRWINTREETGMTAKTLANIHGLLSAAIASAVPKWRPDNPCRGLRLPEGLRQEMTFLTKAEFNLLCLKTAEPYRIHMRFLVSTGLRWGEFAALTVGDLDLDAAPPRVRVTKAVKRDENGRHYIGTPKTPRARRTVSLPVSLVDELRVLVFGRAHDEPLFPSPSDRSASGRLRINFFRDTVWTPAVELANADKDEHGDIPRSMRMNKHPRIHDLRHTHASWLIAAMVNFHVIQLRLGHESIKTTVDRYGHRDPSHLQDAADAADAALVESTVADLIVLH